MVVVAIALVPAQSLGQQPVVGDDGGGLLDGGLDPMEVGPDGSQCTVVDGHRQHEVVQGGSRPGRRDGWLLHDHHAILGHAEEDPPCELEVRMVAVVAIGGEVFPVLVRAAPGVLDWHPHRAGG